MVSINWCRCTSRQGRGMRLRGDGQRAALMAPRKSALLLTAQRLHDRSELNTRACPPRLASAPDPLSRSALELLASGVAETASLRVGCGCSLEQVGFP